MALDQSNLRRDRWLDLWVAAAIALATVLAYAQVRNHGFINFDDDQYVTDNMHVLYGLSWENVQWAFTTGEVSNWHPLTWLSYMADYELFGLNPAAFHIHNVFLHILNAVLLFLVLRRMTGDIWPSALVAAVFALHPLHVESVAWIAERKDVLSTLFWILAMAAYVRYAAAPSLARYVLVVALLILGLMAKPMLVTLPFVLLLLDYWPLQRFDPAAPGRWAQARRLVLEKLPMFPIIAASSIVTVVVQEEAMSDLTYAPWAMRIGNAAIAYSVYIVKMFWPVNLAVLYPFLPEAFSVILALVAAFLIILVTALVCLRWRKHPYLLTGWFWYLGTLVPVIGIIKVGAQAYADRYTYVPLIGLTIAIAWGVRDLVRAGRVPVEIARVAGAGVLVAMLILTWRQASIWRDDLTLFGHAVAVTRSNVVMHNLYGNALKNSNQQLASLEQFQKAIEANPSHPRSYVSLGSALNDLGRPREALAAHQRALEVKPDHHPAYVGMGEVYMRLGQLDRAQELFEKALSMDPDNAPIHNFLGGILGMQASKARETGDTDAAKELLARGIHHFEEALRYRPIHANARQNLERATNLMNEWS